MTPKDLLPLSAYIFTEYYQNNLQPLFRWLAEDAIWIPPCCGRWLRSRKEIIKQASAPIPASFSVGNLTASLVPCSKFFCEIILLYVLDAHYQDGSVIGYEQRVQCTWSCHREHQTDGSVEKKWNIRMVHISNALDRDPREQLYPLHLREYLYNPAPQCRQPVRRIPLKGSNQTVYYVLDSLIVWAESRRSHTLFHMTTGDFLIRESVSKLAEKYPDIFYRPHSSYLINPDCAESISRFYITMQDGTRIPVPEKKYSAVKRDLNLIFQRRLSNK